MKKVYKKILLLILTLISVVIIFVIIKLTNKEIEPTGTIGEIKYEIYSKENGEYRGFESGYYEIENEDNTYTYAIYMGEKGTGGYSITITNLKIDKNLNVDVTVKEKSPTEHDIVTEAFTYPTAYLKLNKKVNSIRIVSKKNIEYKKLNIEMEK